MLAPAPGRWSPLPVLLGATTGGSHQSSGDILKCDEGEQMCHPGVLANSPWFLQFGHGEQDGDLCAFPRQVGIPCHTGEQQQTGMN